MVGCHIFILCCNVLRSMYTTLRLIHTALSLDINHLTMIACTKTALQCIEFNMHHIAINPDCIEFNAYINTRLSYPDPPALHLVCVSEEHVRWKIDGLRQDARFTEVLRLGRLPPEAQQQGQQQQQQQQPSAPIAGPSSSTSAGSDSSTPEEESRLAAGQKVLDAAYRASKRIHGEEPPHMPGLRNVDIGFNQKVWLPVHGRYNPPH